MGLTFPFSNIKEYNNLFTSYPAYIFVDLKGMIDGHQQREYFQKGHFKKHYEEAFFVNSKITVNRSKEYYKELLKSSINNLKQLL